MKITKALLIVFVFMMAFMVDAKDTKKAKAKKKGDKLLK